MKKVVDILRIKLLSRANAHIYETNELLSRAKIFNKFGSVKKYQVSMAPTRNLNFLRYVRNDQAKNKFVIGYIGGAHTNKRVNLLLGIAEALKKQSSNVQFDLTISGDENSLAAELKKQILEKDLTDKVILSGRVGYDQVPSFIANCDALVNISALESFSNNYVEAWSSGIPLIVADLEWANNICGDGAFYIDPMNFDDTARKIISLANETHIQEKLIDGGSIKLSELNTQTEKVASIMGIIQAVQCVKF